jgi:hypothetical protein
MASSDDFFGGSVTPPTPPLGATPSDAAVNPHLAVTKEYAAFGAPPAPAPSAGNPRLPLFIGALVVIVVGTVAFAGYRVFFGGTQIEIPDTLMGMERIDPNSPAAQQLEASVEQVKSEVGKDVDIQVGLFQAQQQVLFVMGGEAGSKDIEGGAASYFAGFEQGMVQSGATGQLTEVDPGANGGQMRCLELPTGGTCAWVDDDTFGAFAMSPLSGSAADTAAQIRDAIEK